MRSTIKRITLFPFVLCSFIRTFAGGNKEIAIMCTVTLEYNPNSALARRKLAALLATGLFYQKEIKLEEPTPDEAEAHRKFREEFLYASKVLSAKAFARHLK